MGSKAIINTEVSQVVLDFIILFSISFFALLVLGSRRTAQSNQIKIRSFNKALACELRDLTVMVLILCIGLLLINIGELSLIERIVIITGFSVLFFERGGESA